MFIKSGRTLTVEEIMEMNKDVVEASPINPITFEKDDDNKWYLPRLNINDPAMWPPQPLDKRKHFTDKAAYETCLGNCCGVPGLKAGCCHLDPDDIEHVLGPLDQEWISSTIAWFRKQGIMFGRANFVVDFEEGCHIGDKFFNGHPVFKSKNSYPFLRFKVDGPRFSCIFLNEESGKCSIYEKRPPMCRNYLCSFVKSNFLVRTPEHPNTYKKIQ